MGELLNQMQKLERPARSFHELARRMQKSRYWPKGDRLAMESLAIYLKELDEKGHSNRLDKRSGARKALADVLGMEPEDLEEQLEGSRGPARPSDSRVLLWELDARFDLKRESLPPGIPQEVMNPRSWPCWWQAPSGSGRTLVGRWLEAQGLATFIQAENWAEAEAQLPSRGPVFVELTHSARTQAPPVTPLNQPICIATDAPPPVPPADPSEETRLFPGPPTSPEWSLVESLPAESWLEELVHWAAERIPPENDFDPEACLRWLKETPLAHQQIDGFGAAMGIVGLFAEFGGRRVRRGQGPLGKARNLSELANLFLKLRLSRTEKESAGIEREQLWKSLRGLAVGLLTRSSRDWNTPRPLNEWHALVHTRPDTMDLHWLEALSVKGGLKFDAEELKQAANKLPPDAFRTVQLLRDLRMLREESPRSFTLRPRWFLAALIEDAAEALLNEPAAIWGTALLFQHGAGIVIEHLIRRCHAGDFSPIRKLLDAPGAQDPAWVAALEGSFRALGITLIEGGEVPAALRSEVFHAQLPWIIERWDDHPVPRIGYDPARSREAPLLELGTWSLAAFALSETLEGQLPASASAIAPWSGDASSKSLQNMLTDVRRVYVDADGLSEPRQRGAVALGGRLLAKLGPVPTNLAPINEIQVPEMLLQSFERGDLSWAQLPAGLNDAGVLRLLPAYVQSRGVRWDAMAQALWNAWLDSLGPEGGEFPQLFWPSQPWASAFWRAIPVEAIRYLVTHSPGTLNRSPEVYRDFGAEQWRAYFLEWAKLRDGARESLGGARLWRQLPASILREALRHGVLTRFDHEARREIWNRIPDAACEELSALMDEGRWTEAIDLAWSPAEDRMPEVINRVEGALSRPDAPRYLLRAWAYETVARRATGWQHAWTLLERLSRPEKS